MRRKSFKDDPCPAARSLDSIGEWWSLLIVRNALFGMRRFSDFQEDLGLAKNILSARLKKLVACGIMKQVPASDGSAYQEYVLTKKGRDLLPVIVALRQWGENYLFSRREKRLQIVDKRTLKPPRGLDVQNVKGDALAPNDLELVTVTTRLAVRASNPRVPGKNPPPRAATSPVSESVHPVQSGAADLCQHIPKGKFTVVADSGRITRISEVVHLDEKRLTSVVSHK